jgi:hypothetical protein
MDEKITVDEDSNHQIKENQRNLLRYHTHLQFTDVFSPRVVELKRPVERLEKSVPDIYQFLTPNSPEVIHSKKIIWNAWFKHIFPIRRTYSDVRESFRVVKAKERAETHKLLDSFVDIMIQLNANRLLLKKFLQENGWILDIISFIIEIIYTISYLIEMQYNFMFPCSSQNSCGYMNLPSWILINRLPTTFLWLLGASMIKLILSTLNTLISDNAARYVLSPSYVIDVGTALPFLIFSRIKGGESIYIPYFIRCFLLIPHLKAMINKKQKWNLKFSELTENLMILLAYLWTMIYFGVCIFNYSETRFPGEKRGGATINQTSDINLMDTVYFVVVTLATVGYGDITPKTVTGQLTVILLIFAGISIVPGLITNMQASIKRQESGAGSYTPGNNPFIVICGHFTDTSRISDIIRTIMNKDRNDNTSLVLLSREKLSTNLKYMLKASKWKERVFVFIGSGLDRRDLQRIQLRRASAAMILTSITAEDQKIEDEHNTLRAWSFYDFAPEVPLYAETLLPETVSLQEDFTSGTLCIHEYQQIFLAYNCIYRGVGTLMINLIRSSKRYTYFDEPWHEQYGDGMSNQIFKEKLNPIFVGINFAELSNFFFQEFQIILFALHLYIPSHNSKHVALNPGLKYNVKEGDQGFFIGTCYEDVRLIQTLTKSQLSRLLQKKETTVPIENILTSSTSTCPISPKSIYHKGYPISTKNSNVPLCLLLELPVQTSNQCIITSTDHLKNFILICSNNYRLFRFVCTLRSVHLTASELKPIVIVCYRPPSEQEFKLFACFPQVYFFIGDPSNVSVLEKVGMLQADRIVLTNLSDAAKDKSYQKKSVTSSYLDSEALHDSSIIMIRQI